MDSGQDIPSPLPFVVSILPLLLSASDVALPASTLSSSVLQRHYYLSCSSDSPSTYLQATSDPSVQDAVEHRREALASTWLEDVKPSEILYSATIHEEQKMVAKIKLTSTAASSFDSDGSASDSSLILLVVYEEAAPPSDSQSGSSGDPNAGAGPSSSSAPPVAMEEEEESGWKYYDLQLPQSKSNLNSSAWHPSVSQAKAALARLTANTSSSADTRHNRSTSVSTVKATTTKRRDSEAQRLAREKQREADAARGLQVEEGPDQDPDDYWAGCESSDDDAGRQSDTDTNAIEEENEDDYWNNYNQQSTGKAGSILESEQAPQDDYTMRFNHDTSASIGHFEYAQSHATNTEADHQAEYSFDSERGERDLPVQGSRILVEEADLRESRPTDTFLTTLQSSLERVSSSQSESQSDNENDNEAALPNGHIITMNGNGHANMEEHQNERPISPTIDSAISKSIAGLWETYLLSSALGGGGKSREIAAYEFMELVQNVVHGETI